MRITINHNTHASATVSNLDRQVEARLNQESVRYTSGRRAVVRALAAGDGPRSAAELHVELGDSVPLSSIYRSLAVLEEAGVAAPHFSTKGLSRYELAEWLVGHHHHLVCLECGAVEDIEMSSEHERGLESLVSEISGAASFAAVNHALEVEGRCARCA